MVPEWPRLTVLGHGFADAAALPVGVPALIPAPAGHYLLVVVLSLVAGVALRFGEL
jgi:hypothetical protein